MWGMFLMCQNTSMRLYGEGIKRYCVLCLKTYSSSSSIVITSRCFATSRLVAPVSVRLVYWTHMCFDYPNFRKTCNYFLVTPRNMINKSVYQLVNIMHPFTDHIKHMLCQAEVLHIFGRKIYYISMVWKGNQEIWKLIREIWGACGYMCPAVVMVLVS